MKEDDDDEEEEEEESRQLFSADDSEDGLDVGGQQQPELQEHGRVIVQVCWLAGPKQCVGVLRLFADSALAKAHIDTHNRST